MKKAYCQASILAVFMLLLLYGAVSQRYSLGQHYYSVTVNDRFLGNVALTVNVEELIHDNRRKLAQQTEEYLLLAPNYHIERCEKIFQPLMSREELCEAIWNTIAEEQEKNTEKGVYVMQAGDHQICFDSLEHVEEFLNRLKAEQDVQGQYKTFLCDAKNHYEGALLAELEASDEKEQRSEVSDRIEEAWLNGLFAGEQIQKREKGLPVLLDVDFSQRVVVYMDYLPKERLSDLGMAFQEVTKQNEPNTIYQVQVGDTLAGIAEKNMTTIESIMELNHYDSEEQAVQVGNQLIIAVPQTEIGLHIRKEISYEENYTVKDEYIDNENWYQNRQEVRAQGQPGSRQIDVILTMENGVETDHEVVAQSINRIATPTIIERGTREREEFIWPVKSYVFSSPFGWRNNRMHKGIDLSCPQGTTVMAALDGTVVSAGWVNGYGNCITIKHRDGLMTRYGHNSELLVEEGQTVTQGQTIALSGNTGNSSGPHVHFEIIVDGVQVNPLEYFN